MYSPNMDEEYNRDTAASNFSVDGLTLQDIENIVTEVPSQVEEYALCLEVMMADQPGRPHPRPFHGMGEW